MKSRAYTYSRPGDTTNYTGSGSCFGLAHGCKYLKFEGAVSEINTLTGSSNIETFQKALKMANEAIAELELACEIKCDIGALYITMEFIWTNPRSGIYSDIYVPMVILRSCFTQSDAQDVLFKRASRLYALKKYSVIECFLIAGSFNTSEGISSYSFINYGVYDIDLYRKHKAFILKTSKELLSPYCRFGILTKLLCIIGPGAKESKTFRSAKSIIDAYETVVESIKQSDIYVLNIKKNDESMTMSKFLKTKVDPSYTLFPIIDESGTYILANTKHFNFTSTIFKDLEKGHQYYDLIEKKTYNDVKPYMSYEKILEVIKNGEIMNYYNASTFSHYPISQ